MNKVICIIPARFGSTRFEGKPLVDICGKTMIQRVYEQARKATSINDIYIATDDDRIRVTANSFGAKTIMTSSNHASGTDRIAEAICEVDSDIVLNVQGDEPLIAPEALNAVVHPLIEDSSIEMATLITPMHDENEFHDPNVVKVVKDKNNFALYFSRSLIPYSREGDMTVVFKQIGVYVYRRDFLLVFAQMKSTPYETVEKLEQLRAIENGHKIKLVETTYNPISVDVPEDVARVERALKQGGQCA